MFMEKNMSLNLDEYLYVTVISRNKLEQYHHTLNDIVRYETYSTIPYVYIIWTHSCSWK